LAVVRGLPLCVQQTQPRAGDLVQKLLRVRTFIPNREILQIPHQTIGRSIDDFAIRLEKLDAK
jgi:hypothetical protein